MNCATVSKSVKPDGERGEDGVAVARRFAAERFIDMLEAGGEGDAVTRKKRNLRGTACQAFERGEPVVGGELADRIHLGMQIERREARPGLADLGNAKPDLCPDGRDRVSRH